jgi:dTDP-4-amino-4,6-dideoxygalactose transaminase
MDGLMDLAGEHDLLIIEDCAQAHGAKYKHRPVGGLGHVAAFSFCQDKIMTTGGEGGMLVTNDENIWRRAWSLRDHGKSYEAVYRKDHPIGYRWLYESIGTNGRMTEMQSAIGRIQIRRLPEWHERRTENAHRISRAIRQYPGIRVPDVPEHIDHAYYRLFAFVVPEALADGWTRDRIMKELIDMGVPCSVGSCPEIYHEMAFHKDSRKLERPLPVAQELGKTSLAFVVHPTLSKQELDKMCTMIEKILEMASR